MERFVTGHRGKTLGNRWIEETDPRRFLPERGRDFERSNPDSHPKRRGSTVHEPPIVENSLEADSQYFSGKGFQNLHEIRLKTREIEWRLKGQLSATQKETIEVPLQGDGPAVLPDKGLKATVGPLPTERFGVECRMIIQRE